MSSARVVALLPMREISERVPGKNYRSFAGRPLFHAVLSTLGICQEVSRVVVDTDSDFIASDIATNFPEVQVLSRPEHLRAGTVSMNEVLLHDIEHAAADLYLQTHSTNPLLQPQTIDRAIRTLRENSHSHDSLFSVTRIKSRFWNPEGRPLNHDPDQLVRTQDLPAMFEENSCIYLFDGATLRRRKNRLGERPLMFEIPATEAWDIDEEHDFEVAEIMYLRRRGISA